MTTCSPDWRGVAGGESVPSGSVTEIDQIQGERTDVTFRFLLGLCNHLRRAALSRQGRAMQKFL